jgi:hypothetical protein
VEFDVAVGKQDEGGWGDGGLGPVLDADAELEWDGGLLEIDAGEEAFIWPVVTRLRRSRVDELETTRLRLPLAAPRKLSSSSPVKNSTTHTKQSENLPQIHTTGVLPNPVYLK